MRKPRLVIKLEGINRYSQVRANQDLVGLLLLICGICCEYNIEHQYTYETMQAIRYVMLIWKPKYQNNNNYKKVFGDLIGIVEMYGRTFVEPVESS